VCFIINFDIFYNPIFFYTIIYVYIYIYLKYYFNKLLIIDKKLKNLSFNYFKVVYSTNSINMFIYILINIYSFYILILLQLFWSSAYYFNWQNNNIYNSFYITPANYLFYMLIFIFLIFTFLVFKKNVLYQKNHESLSAYFLFFITLFYYLLVNNLLILTFIFEFQSIIIIYIISNLFYLKNNSYLNFKKINKQPVWYFNSIVYQFWASFFSAILLIISILIFFKNFFFIDWLNLEIYVYMLNIKFFNTNLNEILIYFTPFIFCLFFKLGLLPFFFWKPEIYKNFTLEILFIYLTFYIFAIIFLVLFIFFNYFFLLQHIFLIIYYPVTIISLIFLPFLFYVINEIRVFLSYSSIFHITIILISLLPSQNFIHFSFLYLFAYLFFSIFFMLLLFYLNNFNIWYLTDFQYFYTNKSVKLTVQNIFLGMAGLPPFMGFFIKLILLSNLYYDANYFLFDLFLISSLIIAFFYMQNFKFYGLSVNKRYFFKNFLIIIFNYSYSFLLAVFILFNTTNSIFLSTLTGFSYMFF